MRSLWQYLVPCSVLAAACGSEPPAAPPAECASAWAKPAAREFVDGLTRATASDRAVWGAYNFGDGAYVLDAGPSDSAGACLGLWRDGRAISYARVADDPTLLTALYGYYFRSDWHGGPDAKMLDRASQPASVRQWLETTGIESAVVMPVSVPNFPIKLPAFAKVQVALHEGFHVVVQAPRWYAAAGDWPIWDVQPDRAGVPACYTATDTVAETLRVERDSLVSLVEHLLDGDSARACTAGSAFLSLRAARYALLANTHVARQDGSPGTCREAEAIMELEEGTADYASWTALYEIGQTSREKLIQRYRAVQRDVFYLTGAMQLHAISLMAPDRMTETAHQIATSQDFEHGSPTAVLRRTLASYCRPGVSNAP